jgi:hypothetical protein
VLRLQFDDGKRSGPAPTFGPFREVVGAMLAQDETAPRKQRHTASQFFRRLRAMYGSAGGYTLCLPIRQAPRIYPCRGLRTIESGAKHRSTMGRGERSLV